MKILWTVFGVVSVGAVVLTGSPAAYAIVSGQIDDFQAGTVANWTGGTAQVNQATDGPAGAGDRWLEVRTTSPAFNGSKLGTRNPIQWSGDYTAAGAGAVSLDLRNRTTQALEMRILLLSAAGGNFSSSIAVMLPADDAWHSAVFGLSASHLTHVGGGSGVLANTLGSVSQILIRHDPGAPSGTGGSIPTMPVSSAVGLDNIAARSPGDANVNGSVTDDDLSLLLANWDQDATGDLDGGWGRGEFNGRAPVDDNDLSLLLANWTAAGLETIAVPEPASASVLLVGFIAAVLRRRCT